MADVDEDRIPSIGQLSNPTDPNDGENDSGSDADSDAAPDYRFLPGTTSAAKKHALPTRGTKDFEPNSTTRQSSTLDNSRKAMADALSVLRVHSTKKGEMVGVYFANEEDWDGMVYDRRQEEKDYQDTKTRTKKSTALTEGEGRCVGVEKFTNTYVRTMGKSDRRNWVWLLPEEALFLIERGSLDIRYEAQEGEDEGELDQEPEDSGTEYARVPEPESNEEQEQAQKPYDESEETLVPVAPEDIQLRSTPSQLEVPQPEGEQSKKIQPTSLDPSLNDQPQLNPSRIPMSLQGAYAAFIGKNGLTLERYTVYANLKRAGFIVQRAPTWHGPVANFEDTTSEILQQSTPVDSLTTSSQSISLITRLLSYLFKSPPKPNTIPCHNSFIGPLISPGLFRNYYDIYRQLHLIPQHDYTERPSHSPPSTSETLITTTPPPPQQQQSAYQPLLPTYYLHKPSALTTYKKTNPPPPSYTVVVIPSRTTQIPTSTQIGDLLASQPEDVLPNADKKKLETRVKHGRRNLLVAVVDCGIVSYLRFSGGGFEESLWGEAERRGAGRGGKGGGRGRGRGRGRGGRGGVGVGGRGRGG